MPIETNNRRGCEACGQPWKALVEVFTNALGWRRWCAFCIRSAADQGARQ